MAEYLLDKEERIIKQLERQYKQALEDVEMDIRILLTDEQTPSRIHRVEYQKRLKSQIEAILENLHLHEYKTINQFLQDSYTDAFVGTMYDLHSQGVPVIVPVDQNAAVKAIQLDTQLSDRKIHPNENGEHVTLYESLGVDVDNLKETIRLEITRGLATNTQPEVIARNIANLTKAPLSRAKTIARTESHRIQEASAQDAREKAISRGARVVKQWDATMDGATREAHRRLDGQIVEVKEPFTYGTLTAMYPGDFGDPAQDCNCRCKAVQRARWMLDEEELETLKARAEFFGLGQDEAKKQQFAEFEKKFLKAAEHENSNNGADGRIKKSAAFAVDPKVIESRGYADKFDSMGANEHERREYLKAAKEMLHHRSGQNGEDLYLYNKATGKWVKSTSGMKAATPDYTDDIKRAITKAQAGELVAFHNHPESMPPSVDDLNAAFYNGYSVGYAFCHNGTVYEYTAPNAHIEFGIYNIRIEYFKKMGYNEHDAQMKTMEYLSSVYGFVFKEVR